MGLSVSRPPPLPNCFVPLKSFNCENPPKEATPHQPPLFLNLVWNISPLSSSQPNLSFTRFSH